MLEYKDEYIKKIEEMKRARDDAEQLLFNAARAVVDRFEAAAKAECVVEFGRRKQIDPNKDHKRPWQPMKLRGTRGVYVDLGWSTTRPHKKGEKPKASYIRKSKSKHYDLHGLLAATPAWLRPLVHDTELEARPIREQYIRLGKLKRTYDQYMKTFRADCAELEDAPNQ